VKNKLGKAQVPAGVGQFGPWPSPKKKKKKKKKKKEKKKKKKRFESNNSSPSQRSRGSNKWPGTGKGWNGGSWEVWGEGWLAMIRSFL